MPQTSITRFRDQLANGTLYGANPHSIRSFVSENVADIPLAYGVVRGTDLENQVLLPSAAFTHAQFAGFAVMPNTKEKTLAAADGTVAWETEDQVPVAQIGTFAVNCRVAYVAGTQCFVQHTLNATINPGELRGTDDATNSDDINARFVTTGDADTIAVIELYAAN